MAWARRGFRARFSRCAARAEGAACRLGVVSRRADPGVGPPSAAINATLQSRMLILFWKTTCWSLRFRTLRYRFWDTADPLLGEPINELEEGSARDSFTLYRYLWTAGM